MPRSGIIVGLVLIALGVCSLAEFRRQRNTLLPLSERRLHQATPTLEIPFRPTRTDSYQLFLWGRYPDTPFEDVLKRLNVRIVDKTRYPDHWIDLEWSVIHGTEVVAAGSISDEHGFAASNPDFSPAWPEFRLQGDTEYVLRIRGPLRDDPFYASSPTVSIHIGDEFQQDGGYFPRFFKWLSWVLFAGGAVPVCMSLWSGRQNTQPGATDNPDDAHRLREDH